MIPFSPPRIDQETIDEVVDTLKSGWITTGPKTKAFEKEISKYCGTQRSICFNSWTASAEMFLRWYGVGPGDEVIIPAYTYMATANVVTHLGAKAVMVDVNPHDFNINIDKVEAAITERTKMIMPVDIAGLPCDYQLLQALVMREDIVAKFQAAGKAQQTLGRIIIFADAAHSFGASSNGRMSGKLADVTAFSFHAVKNLTTAEGGALTFNLPNPFSLEAIYKKLNTMSLHGQSKDALAKTKAGGWRYDVHEIGYKCNMTDIHASLGLVEIKRYEANLARRKEIVVRYNEAFGKDDRFHLPPFQDENRCPSWHLYLLRLTNADENVRDLIIDKISAQGVSVNVHFQPLPMLTAYKNMGYDIADFPVAFDNYQRVISLPVYYQLTDEQVEKVISAVKSATEELLS